MRFLGRLVTTVFILAVAACAAINTAIHIKSGEAKALFTPEEQIEVEADTNVDEQPEDDSHVEQEPSEDASNEELPVEIIEE